MDVEPTKYSSGIEPASQSGVVVISGSDSAASGNLPLVLAPKKDFFPCVACSCLGVAKQTRPQAYTRRQVTTRHATRLISIRHFRFHRAAATVPDFFLFIASYL